MADHNEDDGRARAELAAAALKRAAEPGAALDLRLAYCAEANRLVPHEPAPIRMAIQLGRHHERHPGVSSAQISPPEKVRRRDPDNREGDAIQSDRPAQYPRVRAKAPFPDTVAQNHDGMRPRSLRFLRQKRAAQNRPDPKHREIIVRDQQRANLLRMGFPGSQGPFLRPVTQGERFRAIATIQPGVYWSAPRPRNALCQTWLCAETKPGMTILPPRSSVVAARMSTGGVPDAIAAIRPSSPTRM